MNNHPLDTACTAGFDGVRNYLRVNSGGIGRSADLPARGGETSKISTRRRDQARHLSIGAPVTASFIGLMVLDQTFGGALAAEAGEAGQTAGSTVPDAATLQPAIALSGESAASGEPARLQGSDSTAIGDASLELAAGAALLPTDGEMARASGPVSVEDGEAPLAASSDFADGAWGDDATTIQMASSQAGADTSGSDFPDENLGTIGTRQEGGEGDDVLIGTPDNDTLLGRGGDDRIEGLAGDDLLDGGAGDDFLDGGEGDDRLLGGTGDDVILGGAGDDVADGGRGDDRIDGGEGADRLAGGDGDDLIDGGSGADSLRGDSGDDVLVIDDYADFAFENDAGQDGGGIDRLAVTDGYSESLAARLPGLAPEGLASFVLGGMVGRELPAQAHDFKQQVDPQIENIELRGNAAHDVIGGAGANEIFGNAGGNRLWGEGGDDRLAGGDGDDHLFGGTGDDMLAGEDGEDFLFGEGGDDTFLFGLNDSAIDTVFDHEGRNAIKIEGGDAAQLGARLDGDDLLLSHGDKDIARIRDYAGHEDAFTTVETDGGHVQEIAGLLAETSQAGDILAAFLAPADLAGTAPEDTPSPAPAAGEAQAAADLLQPFLAGTDPFTGDSAGESAIDTPARENVA